MTIVRIATPADSQQIVDVIARAFEKSEHGHQGEAELPAAAVASQVPFLSLVAVEGEKIVGHVLFTAATLTQSDDVICGMGLAPLAVHPVFQSNGIGLQLMQAGLRLVWESGAQFAIVLGSTSYYSRVGFQPAANWNIHHGFEGLPQEYFLIQFRDGTPGEKFVRYQAFYADIFGPQHVTT
jgi:putative acetyltransferase